NVVREKSGLVSSGKPRIGRDQGFIMCQGLRQLVIHAFVVVTLDSPSTIGNTFGDQDSCSGLMMMIRKEAFRHGDRKIRYARQQRKANFPLHLNLRPVTKLAIEIA